MRRWWGRVPRATKILLGIQGIGLLVCMVMIVLLSTENVDPAVTVFVLIALGVVSAVAQSIVQRINERRELDEIVRRVQQEEADAAGL